MTRAEALEAVAEAAQHLFDACVKREASGFRSRERQFAINMLKPYLSALKAAPADDGCVWTQENIDDGDWTSSCGHDFTLIDGTPADNGMVFCTHCGRKILPPPPRDPP